MMSDFDASSFDARPSVFDVAQIIRARTKDDVGDEVGTFDEDTRPTADEVENHIDAAMALVGSHLPPLELLNAGHHAAFAALVAYRAALRVEKSYFPEQVRSDRSAYEELRQEYIDDLNALRSATEDYWPGSSGIAVLGVGSWTSIDYCRPCVPATDPDLFAKP